MKLLAVIKSDSLGRILFPKDIRESYQLRSREVELFYKDKGVYMRTTVQQPPTGLVRKVSSQGKMSIPSSYRKKMEWKPQINLELYHVVDDFLYLQMDRQVCAFCSNRGIEEMILVHEKYICKDCLQIALGKRFMLKANRPD